MPTGGGWSHPTTLRVVCSVQLGEEAPLVVERAVTVCPQEAGGASQITLSIVFSCKVRRLVVERAVSVCP